MRAYQMHFGLFDLNTHGLELVKGGFARILSLVGSISLILCLLHLLLTYLQVLLVGYRDLDASTCRGVFRSRSEEPGQLSALNLQAKIAAQYIPLFVAWSR